MSCFRVRIFCAAPVSHKSACVTLMPDMLALDGFQLIVVRGSKQAKRLPFQFFHPNGLSSLHGSRSHH